MARLLALCLSLALVGIDAGDQEPTPPKLPLDMCPLCQMATGILEKQLKATEKAAQTIGAALMQACASVDVCDDVCELFVHQFAGLFAYSFSVTDYSLDGFCTGVFFCPPPFYQVMRQNGLFEATCQICERTLTAIAGSLTSDQTAASAQKRIVQICSAPPAVDTEKCKAVVGGALTQALQTTKAVLDPKTFCTAVGPCALPQPTPSKSPISPEEEHKPMVAELESKAKYLVT